MSLDNFDMYKDDETTSETNSLATHDAEDDGLEEAYVPGSGGSRAPKNNNRIFMIALGLLAAVFIISIIVMIIFASVNLPQRQQAMTQTAFAISMGNESTISAATTTAEAFAQAAAETVVAAQATPTEKVPTPTEKPVEPTATATAEAVVAPEEEAEPTQDTAQSIAQTATIQALLTQVAAAATATEEVVEPTPNAAQLTATAQAAALEGQDEELPETGFMQDGGLYLVSGTALVLIAIIVVVRRIRKG